MDTFVEQIVAIKRTWKMWMAYVGLALVAIAIMAIAIWVLTPVSIVIVALTFYGTFKLYSMLSIEYEYIITNSTMDIDKIIGKSSRKRVLSFDLTAVQRVEKYTGKLPSDVSKGCFFACNSDDSDAYIVYYKEEGKAQKNFVFAPNERTRNAMKNFLPRHLSENL